MPSAIVFLRPLGLRLVDLEVVAPFAGMVTDVNAALADAPELLNQEPYGAGWLVDMRPTAWPVSGLLDAEAYLEIVKAQARQGAGQ